MRRAWAWVVAACFLGVPGLAQAGGYPFQFKAGSPSAVLGPRFKPMSSSVSLKAASDGAKGGVEHRQGHLRVGPAGSKLRRLVVSRTKSGEAFDRLLIDTDGDGSLDDETPIEAKLQSSGQTTWSTFHVVLRVNHGTAEKPQIEEHPFRTYLAVAGRTATPEAFNYMSVGFRVGRVEIDGLAYDVVLTDRNNDGRYGVGDAWTIRSTEMKGPPQAGDAYGLRDAVSAGGRKWLLVLDGTGGRRARIVKEGEAAGARPGAAGNKHPDGAEPRADIPLEFAETIEAGRKKAAETRGPLYLSFESERSKESLDMRERVYGARAVVGSVPGLSCVRVDIDAMPGLKVQYKVDKAPTGILLDPEGAEVARFSGYRSVKDFRAFLGAAHPWLLAADDEPKLSGKNRKRHQAEVKRHVTYLQDKKHAGNLVDRIKELGKRKNRCARDALIRFASGRRTVDFLTEAFYALALVGGRTSIEFLCGPKALGSKDHLVAQPAALAIGTAKDARAVEPLLEVLAKRGTKVEVLSASCIALARCAPEDKRVVDHLFEQSKNAKDTIRAGATEALGYLRSDAAVARLRSLLQRDKSTRARAAAATGMGHTKRMNLIPLLRKAVAEDKGHAVRTAALKAISELQAGAVTTK